MTGGDDSLQSISVRFDGKNYGYWSYVMKNFLKGKKMWNYISGVLVAPKSYDANFVELLDVWDTNNSKIITWINNSVEHKIGTQLAKFDTAKEVWDHLERLYVRSNFAVQYQLEGEIRALTQGDRSVQEFYSEMTNFWDQLAMTECAELRAFGPYIERREQQRLVQLLYNLRSEYEGIRGSILHRTPLPSVDSVVHELLAEETRLKTQIEKSTPVGSVLVTQPSHIRSKQKSYDKDECRYCHEKGHWKNQCPLLNQKGKPQQEYGKRPSDKPSYSQNLRFGGQPNTAAVMPTLDPASVDSSLSDNASLVNLLQNLLQANKNQSPPYAMSAPSTSGSEIKENTWDWK